MKLRLKEDPREWRKVAWMTLGGVAVLTSILRWRHALGLRAWVCVLGTAAVLATLAAIQPSRCRGFYRGSTWLGYWLSQALARVVLALIFLVLFVPLGVCSRLLGKDSLRLKRSPQAQTYWTDAKPTSPLDRMF